MMISPETFISEHENDSFSQLIQERGELIQEILKLEKLLFDEDSTSEEWECHPRPEVKYQMNLEYLAELCRFISKKYNKEIVWGELDDIDNA